MKLIDYFTKSKIHVNSIVKCKDDRYRIVPSLDFVNACDVYICLLSNYGSVIRVISPPATAKYDSVTSAYYINSHTFSTLTNDTPLPDNYNVPPGYKILSSGVEYTVAYEEFGEKTKYYLVRQDGRIIRMEGDKVCFYSLTQYFGTDAMDHAEIKPCNIGGKHEAD